MMQAGEHLNKWVKTRQVQTSNKHKRSVVTEVSSHSRNGKDVKSFKRRTGPTGAHQVLQLSLMKDKISSESLTPNTDITEQEAARIRFTKKAVQSYQLHKKLTCEL